MRRGGAALSSLLAFSLLLSPGAGAQTAPAAGAGAPGTEPEPFAESIDVEVVNVEVYVTDRQGQPVTGLGRDDFQLFEDGKPVAISNFYTVEGSAGGSAVAPEAAPGAPPAPAASPATAAPPAVPAAVPEEQRLHLAVFVDDANLTPVARNQVLRQVREFIGTRLKSDDRMMLATYDGGSLRLRQAPTADPAVLGAALEAALKESARGIHTLSDHRRILHDLTLAQTPEQAAEVRAEIEVYAQQREVEIRATIRTLEDFVSSLAGLPGRKALFYVSGGLSLEPGDALLQAWNRKFGGIEANLLDGMDFAVQPLLNHLGEHANASRVTFYSLGVSESASGRNADAEYNPEWSQGGLENVEAAHKSDSLFDIAADTGGLAVADARLAGQLLTRVRRDLDSYYSLGFVPAHPRDGRQHPLEVRMKERALKVRHRESYRAITQAEERSGHAMSALMLGSGGNPLGLALQFGAGKKVRGQWLVPVLVKFPLDKMVLVPQGASHDGRLRLYVGARDDHDRQSPLTEILIPLRIPADKLAATLQQTGAYGINLQMREGTNRVAVTLWDELGQTESTVIDTCVVGKAKSAAR